MKSVTGGGHFGGGMFINAYDMARFGYLFLQNGEWDGRQLISRKWIEMAKSPGPANSAYGFCNWFLNNPTKTADGTLGPLPFPSAPRSSVTFQGNGVNVIYLDWENDLLIVVRWIDSNRSLDQFIGKVLGCDQGSIAASCENGSTKTVAVVGASSNRSKFGNKALRAFANQGYSVIPIVTEMEVEGHRAYVSVLDVPQSIDMATIYAPAAVGVQRYERYCEEGDPGGVAGPGCRRAVRSLEKARSLGLKMVLKLQTSSPSATPPAATWSSAPAEDEMKRLAVLRWERMLPLKD